MFAPRHPVADVRGGLVRCTRLVQCHTMRVSKARERRLRVLLCFDTVALRTVRSTLWHRTRKSIRRELRLTVRAVHIAAHSSLEVVHVRRTGRVVQLELVSSSTDATQRRGCVPDVRRAVAAATLRKTRREIERHRRGQTVGFKTRRNGILPGWHRIWLYSSFERQNRRWMDATSTAVFVQWMNAKRLLAWIKKHTTNPILRSGVASTVAVLGRRVLQWCTFHSFLLAARNGRDRGVVFLTRSSKTRFFGAHVVEFFTGGVLVRFEGRSGFVVAYLTVSRCVIFGCFLWWLGFTNAATSRR